MSNRELLREGLEKFGVTTTDKVLNDFSIYREMARSEGKSPTVTTRMPVDKQVKTATATEFYMHQKAEDNKSIVRRDRKEV